MYYKAPNWQIYDSICKKQVWTSVVKNIVSQPLYTCSIATENYICHGRNKELSYQTKWFLATIIPIDEPVQDLNDGITDIKGAFFHSNIYVLALNAALQVGYFRARKGAEFIGNKNTNSKDTNDRISSTDSVTYFQLQFPLLVRFYTVAEVKWLLIIDSKLSSMNNF